MCGVAGAVEEVEDEEDEEEEEEGKSSSRGRTQSLMSAVSALLSRQRSDGGRTVSPPHRHGSIVTEEKARVHALCHGALNSNRLDLVPRLSQPRRIRDVHGEAMEVERELDDVARRAGHGGHDCRFALGCGVGSVRFRSGQVWGVRRGGRRGARTEPVEERALACIGRADDGEVDSLAEDLASSPVVEILSYPLAQVHSFLPCCGATHV